MNPKLIWNNIILSGIVSICVCLAVPAVKGQLVSFNITQYATDVQQINTNETFGVPSLGSDVGLWNNINQPHSGTGLTYANGLSSTVGYTVTSPGGWGTAATNYNNTPMRGFLADYTGTTKPSTVELSGLNASFASGYYLIVYLTGFNANLGASIDDGSTTYYYQAVDFTSSTWDGTLVQTTATADSGSGANPVAQYAIFGSSSSPLTADTITLTERTLYGGGAGIGGLQIMGVPEPASASVALLGLGLFGLFIRRPRKQG